jgi:hypothetical protein
MFPRIHSEPQLNLDSEAALVCAIDVCRKYMQTQNKGCLPSLRSQEAVRTVHQHSVGTLQDISKVHLMVLDLSSSPGIRLPSPSALGAQGLESCVHALSLPLPSV